MRKNEQFDEKQLYDRGKCFQISFVAALICIVISFFITGLLEVNVSSFAIFDFSFWVPFTVCIVSLIIKDAYDGVNSNSGKFLATLWGICGIVILLVEATDIIILISKARIGDIEIDQTIGEMIQALCMIVIGVVYYIKQYINKKSLDEGD